jgi:hypothetical protein
MKDTMCLVIAIFGMVMTRKTRTDLIGKTATTKTTDR